VEPTDNRILQSENAVFFANLPPAAAGTLRGITLGVLLVIIKGALDYLTSGQVLPTGWDLYVPIILALLRSAEGVLDQHAVNNAAKVRARRTIR